MATPSIDAPVTPLRQRMQQDMLMRGLGPHTQQDYIRHVRRFAAFLGCTPDAANAEDIRKLRVRNAMPRAYVSVFTSPDNLRVLA